MAASPPQRVLEAFGCTSETVTPLSGGQGQSFRCGDAVLKPVDDPIEAEWAAEIYAQLAASPSDDFQVPAPIRSNENRHHQFVYNGWSAYRLVPGTHGPEGRWKRLLKASRAFHAALRSAARPSFLDARSHPWAVADRVAWEEVEIEVVPQLRASYERLKALRRPVAANSQIVHADLTGNVLFTDEDDNGKAPAIIDFSAYWRPVEYAEAVVVVDGVLYFGQGEELLLMCLQGDASRLFQMLVRASIFRLVAENGLGDVSERDVRDFERLVTFVSQMNLKLSNG